MALLTLHEACEALRLDAGDSDDLVQSYIDTLPDYFIATTGSEWSDSAAKGYSLAKTCAKFLICQWFDMNIGYQDEISRLLATLSVIARSNSNG